MVARHRGTLWIVFGNRRLKILKELEPHWLGIKVYVIVHDLPNPVDMEPGFARTWTARAARAARVALKLWAEPNAAEKSNLLSFGSYDLDTCAVSICHNYSAPVDT